ncbi:hypothetical protein IQ06DRAFT_288511 [Phaeosphaeriaceae sp. SRC1lsM3a]|nr:hypothetical protein IQ06DRAFT_288511 [Stagonospora sp. SRC1lsM3a]
MTSTWPCPTPHESAYVMPSAHEHFARCPSISQDVTANGSEIMMGVSGREMISRRLSRMAISHGNDDPMNPIVEHRIQTTTLRTTSTRSWPPSIDAHKRFTLLPAPRTAGRERSRRDKFRRGSVSAVARAHMSKRPTCDCCQPTHRRILLALGSRRPHEQ